MKLQAIAFAALIALSGAASANFFDGFDNGAATGNTAGNGTGTTAADGTGYGTGNGDVNGFGRGKGDADGEVEFAVTFKGQGKTNMDTDMAANGKGNGDWYGAGNGYGYGEQSRNFAGNAATSKAGSAPMMAAPMPQAPAAAQ
jgi:hypothetical protein